MAPPGPAHVPAASCPDWFSPGSPNDLYTAALGSFFIDGATPSFACRQVASTVHTLELIGPQDGSNFLFDDPRKVCLPSSLHRKEGGTGALLRYLGLGGCKCKSFTLHILLQILPAARN